MEGQVFCWLSPTFWPPICSVYLQLCCRHGWVHLHVSHHFAGLLHYLDDFITAGSPNSTQCASNLQTALFVCQKLGLPLHPGKCVGPSTRMVILGIELDSVEQYARLPEEKLAALRELNASWRHHQWCSQAQLEWQFPALCCTVSYHLSTCSGKGGGTSIPFSR